MPARPTKTPAPGSKLTAPFPWFGGKATIANQIWERLGNVDNYVEPFAGSLAVLLARPDSHEWWQRRESAGDYAGHVVNFFRALAANPDQVAHHATWPVTEADLTARHLYLVRYEPDLATKLATDPTYYDAQAAGWWVWGISAWVGGDWMTGKGPWHPGDTTGPGVYRKMPMMAGSHGGKGIHKPLKLDATAGTPDIRDAYETNLTTQFRTLANRLHRVRLACGDWTRLTRAVMDPGANKTTGVLLDPPYDPALRRSDLYGSADSPEADVHAAARDWALTNGDNPRLRIAYCSYSTDEEDTMFTAAHWTPLRWTARGGYGLQANNNARTNRDREIIWFSPACLTPETETEALASETDELF